MESKAKMFGHSIHQMLIVFPLGLLAASLAFDIAYLIQGDGTSNGSRTLKTGLPSAMQRVLPESVQLAYRDRIVEIARRVMPGRVGVSVDGFAGRFLQEPV